MTIGRRAAPARANLVRMLAQKLDQPSATPGNIHVVYLKNANAATERERKRAVAANEFMRNMLGSVQPSPLPAQPGQAGPPNDKSAKPTGADTRSSPVGASRTCASCCCASRAAATIAAQPS